MIVLTEEGQWGVGVSLFKITLGLSWASDWLNRNCEKKTKLNNLWLIQKLKFSLK